MRAALPGLLEVLERSRAEIDRTFAAAGERLGQGLTMFEALNARLLALSGELVAGQMEDTRKALLSVVAELRAFGRGLPGEFAALKTISGHGEAASRSLDRLTDHIRLIAAVACSARIEAAQVEAGRNDRGFFDEIGVLVARARQTIDGYAAEHGRLMGLLSTALTYQQGFMLAYGPKLAALADRLERTMDRIEDCRRGNAATTAEAARQSREIADAVGGAIIALQCGDSTRQRIEHALAALCLADGMPGPGPAAAVPPGDAATLEAVLRHLAAAQLHGAAEAMAQDVREIDRTLRLLSHGILDGHAGGARTGVKGAEGVETETFLVTLEAEMAEATALVGKCNAAFATVKEVTGALGSFVEQVRQTAAALSEIVQSIVLIGLNSGLHAARLGNGGRGLVVIAHELKSVADRIVADAAALSPVFELMHAAAAGLRDGGRGDVQGLAALDRLMGQSVAAMKGSGTRFTEVMDGLTADGRCLSVMMDQACHAFAVACEAGATVGIVADRLMEGADAMPPACPPPIRDVLERTIWPSYTMAAERTLHHAALGALGIGAAAAA